MKKPKPPHFLILNPAVVCCFFLSGTAGLIYQILWARMIDKIVGSAPFAVATVLSIFMGGLALGSYIAGRTIDRISSKSKLLSIYGKVELAVGLYGLLLPLLLFAVKPLYVSAYNLLFDHFLLYQLFSFLGCAVLLIIPTTLMGVTLPVLCRYYVVNLGHIGIRTGRLYGINTFGAMAGALLCGLVLIARLGMYGSLMTAVGINLLVGILCIGLARKHHHAIALETAAEKSGSRRPKRQTLQEAAPGHPSTIDNRVFPWALFIFFISGFCAMAYEVFWTRLLGLIIGPTTYSFTLVVTTFIAGLALGSILFGWLADRVNKPFWLLVTSQFCAAFLALFISQFLGHSQFFFSKLIYVFRDNFGEMLFIKSLVLFFLLVGPTIFLGAAFPLVNKIRTRSLPALGKSIGNAYAVNTIGAILGSFIAGLILIPFCGKENGLKLAVTLQATVAMAALIATETRRLKKIRSWRLALSAVVLVGALLVKYPSWNRSILSGGWYHRYDELKPHFSTTSWFEAAWKGSTILSQHKKNSSTLVFYGDGIAGFTTVEKEVDSIGATHYSLYNSGKADASTHPGDRSTQTLLAHFPLLFHPNPENVMVLGLASGMTAGEALLYPVKRMDVLEISDQVLEACLFFAPWNNDCLSNPTTNVIVQDGRNHLELTRETYQVIISEPSNPWMAGLANLFTLEFFKTVKDRLSDDGIFVQWIHSYEMDWSSFAMVGRTFAEVFPDGLLLKTSSSDFLLVGFKEEKQLDLATADRNIHYAKKSTNITIRDSKPFFRMIATEDLKAFFGSGPLHTDNLPLLEFAAPKNLDIFDATIAERATNGGWLSPYTSQLVDSGNDTDSLLDMLELSLARSSPLFHIVDLNEASPKQKARYEKILMNYCSNVFVDNYEIFPSEDLKASCARLQVSKIEDAMKLGKQDAVDYFHSAVAHRILGETGEEISMLQEAILIDPDLYNARNNLGIALSRQGRLDEATAQFSEALRIKPGDKETLNNIGNVFAAQGKTDKALSYYYEAIQGRLSDPEILGNIAGALAAQGNVDEAINYYSRALQIDPDHLEAHRKLGSIYINQGSFNTATKHFQEVVRLDPDNPDTYSEIGSVLASQGQFEDAAEYFLATLKINPNHLSANYNLGLVLTEKQDFDAAVAYLEKAALINPDDPSVHNALGVVLGRSGRISDARNHFSESLRLNPGDAKVHDNLGLTLLQMGQYEEASACFSKALEIDNSFDVARSHLEFVQRQFITP